jgi:hypothetical protein
METSLRDLRRPPSKDTAPTSTWTGPIHLLQRNNHMSHLTPLHHISTTKHPAILHLPSQSLQNSNNPSTCTSAHSAISTCLPPTRSSTSTTTSRSTCPKKCGGSTNTYLPHCPSRRPDEALRNRQEGEGDRQEMLVEPGRARRSWLLASRAEGLIFRVYDIVASNAPSPPNLLPLANNKYNTQLKLNNPRT